MEASASPSVLHRQVDDAGDPRTKENYEIIKRIL